MFELDCAECFRTSGNCSKEYSLKNEGTYSKKSWELMEEDQREGRVVKEDSVKEWRR